MAFSDVLKSLGGYLPTIGGAVGGLPGLAVGGLLGGLGGLAGYLASRRRTAPIGSLQAFPGGQMTTSPQGQQYLQFSRLTPEQLSLQNQLLGSIGPLLSNLQQPFSFEPIAQQARTQFEQKTIPSIAERFTRGGEGGQSTEAFKHALGEAGAGLEQGLAAQQAQMGLQQRGLNLSLLSALLGGGMQSPYESFIEPREPSFWQTLAGTGAKTAGKIGPMLAMKYLGL